MSNTSTKSETTKRISDEMFEEVERELAAANPVSAGDAEIPASLPVAEVDRLNRLSELALPYVWMIAIGVWVSGIMVLQERIPMSQCLGAGLVVASALSAIVFAWRSRLS